MVGVHVVAHLRDGLVPGLKFGPDGNSAEYAHSAKLVEFRAEASGRFSLADDKVIRFRRVGDCWLQAGTAIFSAQLFNNSTHGARTPVAPPGCMIRSMMLFLGGQVCEPIDETTVLLTVLDRIKPSARAVNGNMPAHSVYKILNGNRGRRVVFELPLGLCKQQRWPPLHIMSQLVVELTLGAAGDALTNAGLDWELRDVALLGT